MFRCVPWTPPPPDWRTRTTSGGQAAPAGFAVDALTITEILLQLGVTIETEGAGEEYHLVGVGALIGTCTFAVGARRRKRKRVPMPN